MATTTPTLPTPPFSPIKQPGQFWLRVCATLLFFVLIRIALSYLVLSSFSRVLVDTEFDHPDTIQVFFSVTGTFNESLSRRSKPLPTGQRTLGSVDLHDHIARNLRVDLGSQPGTIKLYGISLTSHYGQRIDFSPTEIFEKFTATDGIASITRNDDHLLIISRTNDPTLVFKGELLRHNTFFSIVLPLIFSFIFFLFISTFSLRQFPAIHDLSHKTSSMGVNISSIDGIRGLAALIVLAEHCGLLNGIGALGVWLFFALSGFLLATPFVQTPAKAVSYAYMTTYLLRRLKRILPMYYTYLTIFMLFLNKNPAVFRHYLFLQGDGHLWTIAQEMIFYLILPFVVIALYLLCQGRKSFCLLLLAPLTYAANSLLPTGRIWLYGYGTEVKCMTSIFLSGVLFCYLYHWLHETSFFHRLDRQNFRNICSGTGLTLMAILIALSTQLIDKLSFFTASRYPATFGFLAGLFILLVVLSGRSLLARIMSFTPLRAIGLVGFSFYLLHPVALALNKQLAWYYGQIKPGAISFFIVTAITTYFFAACTYSYIERPFLNKQA